MRNLELQKGKGNGQKKAYDHAVSTNLFGVAEPHQGGSQES